jgi:hypothetical protein
MRHLIEYIEDNTSEIIEEGFFANLLGKLGNFLVKKFGVSENTSKELESNLNNENDSLNKEISKVSKGKINDLNQWWKAYTVENKNAAKAKSPIFYNQTILKNTNNVTIPMKKMLDSYQSIGILNNTIICMFIKVTCNQFSFIIESIIKDDKTKIQLVNQLTNLQKLLSTIKIADNKDGEKFIKDAITSLEKNAKNITSKYKK